MRIRRCASKLLGSTTAYFSPPQTPTPTQTLCSSPAWDSEAASAAAAAGLLCELNRSPWDLGPNHQHAISQEGEGDDTAADDYDKGTPANGIKLDRKPVDPPLIKSDVKIKVEEEEEKEKEKRVKRRRKEKGIDAGVATKTSETAAPFCKKSDGKGWHCKRLAHLPHSLCHYHLTQLRSYASNNSHGKVADQATGGGDKQRKKKVGAAGAGTNFYYYYYSGFGPWRGKRRGGTSGENGGGGVNGNVTEEEEEEEEEEDEEEEEEEGRANSESVDVHDAPVAGDDEEDNEEEEDGKGCLDDEEEDEKRNSRKRGRKPVKARSLKSLL